jgi:anthranilate synthase component 1
MGGPADLGRFDILFAFPQASLTLNADWSITAPLTLPTPLDFLATLDQWWSAEQIPAGDPGPSPFRGGWFVFLAYELAQQIETRLSLRADPTHPVAKAVRVPAAVVRNRHGGEVFALAEEGSAALLQIIESDVRRLSTRDPVTQPHGIIRPGSIIEDAPKEYLAAVERAQRYIEAGEIYQANISRQWRGELSAGTAAAAVYERLRRTNPAPFAGLAVFDGIAVVSSSPERLLRIRAGRAETRPIAGTRPRMSPRDPDHARRHELLASPKERAEHVMLIDLERNDLGRVCRAGSVRVDQFMAVESYAYVHHIVSNISGDLRPGTPPGEVLRAVFPGGTITGCPKVRCMSIIRELEGRPRGVYTGSIGYLNRDGSCDFNILIRTITVRDREWSLNAGSGIVADSDPQRELEETRAKAKGMLLSLGA